MMAATLSKNLLSFSWVRFSYGKRDFFSEL